MLVRQHLDVGQQRGVINGHVNAVIANTRGSALLPVASDAMTDLEKMGELFDVDVDQGSGLFPLVALDRMYGCPVSTT